MGGSDGVLLPLSGTTLFRDVWSPSDDGVTWDLVTDSAEWSAREGISGQSSGNDLVIAGTSLVAIGGEKGFLPWDCFDDLWTNDDGKAWTKQRSNNDWKCRTGHVVAQQPIDDGSVTMWLAGGFL